ncbi:uncharacterized protein LOC133196931 [Saccostrea echinata]|uniref:uncharacterized protein LOC133196931 n=1 Tax=Saccostrea echinata TaxID=191078 RepID=UPI002A836B73|nr:uncharacterized protein LOC133196931 [Saccostrea echinata]
MYNFRRLLVCSSLSLILAFTFHNTRLENHVIRTVSNIGPCSCKLECYSSTDCASINYKWETFHCEISADDMALGTMQTSEFYHYSSLDDIKQEFPDPCCGIKCGPHSKCVHTFSGIQCITSECGEPHTVINSNTTFQSSKRAFGTVLIYHCNNVSTPSGDLTSICQLNGTWSNVTGRCENIVCGEVPSIPNGNLSTGSDVYSSIRNITCYTGFNLTNTTNTVTCQLDGEWSSVNTACVYECPGTFYHDEENRLCIHFSNELKTWDDADNTCKTYSQRLININTPAQVTLLKNYLRSLVSVEDNDDIYIGGKLEGDVYRWVVTDQIIDSSVWDDGYPSAMKNCTLFHDTQHLRDKECTKLYKFACGAFY